MSYFTVNLGHEIRHDLVSNLIFRMVDTFFLLCTEINPQFRFRFLPIVGVNHAASNVIPTIHL